jgi:hypothetical protein
MFSYFLARPRKETLADEQGLARYSSAEEERERRAAQRRGTYSTAQYLEVLAWPLVQRVARLTGAIT